MSKVIVFSVLFMFGVLKMSAQDNRAIDSLEKVILSNKADTVKVLTYSELCWQYRVVDQKKALENGKKAVSLARKIDFQFGLGQSLNDLSIIYLDRGSLDTAIVLLEEAKSIRKDLGDDAGVAAIHNKLGIAYELQHKLEDAMANQLAALEYYESIDYKVGAGYCLNNIGNIHYQLGNYDKAIEIHERTLLLRTEINDAYGIAGSHSNLANALTANGDTLRAIYHIDEAIKIYRRNNFDTDLSVLLNNLGEIYIGLGQIRKAEEAVKESYDLRIKLEDERGIVSSSLTLGQIYTMKGSYFRALKLLHEALSRSKEAQYRNKEKLAYQYLGRLHAKLNNADSVDFYYTKFFEIEKEQYTAALTEQVNELQTIYETEKKDKENEELARAKAEEENKRKTADLKVANRTNWIIGISGLALILLFLGLFLYQRKVKLAQHEKNLAVLEEKQKGLEAVFDATEEERQRIAKDLHDGVGQQMSGLKLAWENLSIELNKADENSANKLQDLSEILNETAQEVREISHQMMPKVLSEFGLLPALEQMLEKSLKFSEIKVEFESFNITNRFSQRIEISIYRIAQELINNVIKHSGATFVSVQIFQNKHQLILIVEDNGSGFVEKNNEGHGLLNIKSRLNTINGEVNFEASSERGTMATIRVDLSNMS